MVSQQSMLFECVPISQENNLCLKHVVLIGKDCERLLQIICKRNLYIFQGVVFVEEESFALNTQSKEAVIKRAWTCIKHQL